MDVYQVRCSLSLGKDSKDLPGQIHGKWAIRGDRLNTSVAFALRSLVSLGNVNLDFDSLLGPPRIEMENMKGKLRNIDN